MQGSNKELHEVVMSVSEGKIDVSLQGLVLSIFSLFSPVFCEFNAKHTKYP